MRKKEIVKRLGGNHRWKGFMEWMRGQTVGVYPDGETDFYEHDVNAYVRKLRTGYDRQNDPEAWD